MSARLGLIRRLSDRLPFYYGWVILAVVCAAGFSRQGPAVATLSIFVEPMTSEFGWSRTEISLAVSMGGILGALVAPFIGPFLDRNGARAILCFAVLFTGAPILALSATPALLFFYLFYCTARMNFAGPYDLGIYGSIVNWFVRRRSLATSIATLAQMAGLVAMPLIAHLAMAADGWRAAWLAIGATVLVVGFLPVWALLVRRPEDLGLRPDGEGRVRPRSPEARRAETAQAADTPAGEAAAAAVAPKPEEPAFTRPQALRTPAFWLLSLFTLAIYPVQAGVSLHQAPHLIELGFDAGVAATVVSTFSALSAVAGFAYGFWPKRAPIRLALASIGLALGIGSWLMNVTETVAMAYGSAALFGVGIGGLLTMLPIAWADYFGRRSYGAIRGVALTVQVVAQASGPVISGVLRDTTGDYHASLVTFAVLGLAGAAVALFTAPPAGR